MKTDKLIAVALASMTICAGVYAQSSKSGNETSVESEYMSSMEDIVIMEMANSDQRDNKLVALQYLEEAADNGNISPDMMAALNQLSGEGISTQSRTKGRLSNNYPDIRAKACDLLGEIPTEESKNTLVGIANEDKEPMVVTAAIRSLGNIGINDNDEVVQMIEFVQRKYAAVNPTSSLALEILNAYEKLAPTVQDRNAMIQSIGEIATNYKYVTPVRTRARDLMKKLQSGSTGSNSGGSDK